MIGIIKIYNYNQHVYQVPDKAYLYSKKYPRITEKRIYLDCTNNDLLLEPEYNFISTLEKSEEYNKAFELWLKGQTKKDFRIIPHEGKYYLVMDIEEVVTNVQGEVKFPMSDKMLLGYHIEFIKESIRSK